MTTVAALAWGHTVYMAADSASYLDGRVLRGTSKITVFELPTRTDPEMAKLLVGGCGHAAVNSMIRHHWNPEVLPDVNDVNDCDSFMDAAAQAITELVMEASGVDEEDRRGWAALAGYAGRLYHLFPHGAIYLSDGIAAVGSGSELALGALHALVFGIIPYDPMNALHEAMGIAAHHDDGTTLPAEFHTA